MSLIESMNQCVRTSIVCVHTNLTLEIELALCSEDLHMVFEASESLLFGLRLEIRLLQGCETDVRELGHPSPQQ